MRGVFDEREAEQSRKRRDREGWDGDGGNRGKRDREVTLGTFTLLAIFFGLVVVCGLSFGLGYVVGRREPATASTVLEPKPVLSQRESAKGKPAGGAGGGTVAGAGNGPGSDAAGEASGLGGAEESGQHAGGLPQASDAGETGADSDAAEASKTANQIAQGGANLGKAQSALAAISSASKAQAAAKAPQQTQVKPALPKLEAATNKAQDATAPALMVRVAALEHQDDADVLVDALRRRGYSATAHRDAVDGMVHVRVGPFASRDVANQWRQKLQNDGYNAVVESQ
jgi:hypothetical protein